jgi:hypothetical protein
VKLPSGKLQISKAFEVASDSVTSFVYDLTVVAAGSPQSGIKYILKPQVGQSGADQKFEKIDGKGEKRGRQNEPPAPSRPDKDPPGQPPKQDTTHVPATISSTGVHQGRERGIWYLFTLAPRPVLMQMKFPALS